MIVGGSIKKRQRRIEKSRVALAHLLGLCSPLPTVVYSGRGAACITLPTSKRKLIFCLFSGRPGETEMPGWECEGMVLLRDNVCFQLLRNCLADHQNRRMQRERSRELKQKTF